MRMFGVQNGNSQVFTRVWKGKGSELGDDRLGDQARTRGGAFPVEALPGNNRVRGSTRSFPVGVLDAFLGC